MNDPLENDKDNRPQNKIGNSKQREPLKEKVSLIRKNAKKRIGDHKAKIINVPGNLKLCLQEGKQH